MNSPTKTFATALERFGWAIQFGGGFIRVFANRLGQKGPKSAWIYLRVRWANFHAKLRNKGDSRRVECCCCGWTGYDFLPLDGTIFWVPSCECPQCHGHDRHRSLHMCLEKLDSGLRNFEGRVLHLAPEPQVIDVLKQNPGVDYYAADLEIDKLRQVRGRAFRTDVRNIAMPDNSVDLLFCLHMLEHVKEDEEGLAEIHRVLRPGGIAYIMVPIDFNLDETVFFGKPHPDIFDHYWAYAQDFTDKLTAFEFEAHFPNEFLTREEVFHFSVPNHEIVYRCVKPSAGPALSVETAEESAVPS